MKTFLLEPTDDSSPTWAASLYRGQCAVGARSEGEARKLAASQFAVFVKRAAGRRMASSPWLDRGVVACIELDREHAPMPHGRLAKVKTFVPTPRAAPSQH